LTASRPEQLPLRRIPTGSGTPTATSRQRSEPTSVQRPTLGRGEAAVDTDRDAGPESTQPVQRSSGTADDRPRPGIGEPLRRLPPSARPAVGFEGRAHTVSARGVDAATQAAMQRLLSGQPPGHGSSEASTEPAGRVERPGPVRPGRREPTVVARAVDPPGQSEPEPPSLGLVGDRSPVALTAGRQGHDDGPADVPPPRAAVAVRWEEPTADRDADEGLGATGGRSSQATRRSQAVTQPTRRHAPATPRGDGAGRTTGTVAAVRGPGSMTSRTAAVQRHSEGPQGRTSRDLPVALHPGDRATDVSTARAVETGGATAAPVSPDGAAAVGESVARAVAPETGPGRGGGAPAGDATATIRDASGDDVADLTSRLVEQLSGRDADLGTLARGLYPWVRDELRWELRTHRERVGLLGDPL